MPGAEKREEDLSGRWGCRVDASVGRGCAGVVGPAAISRGEQEEGRAGWGVTQGLREAKGRAGDPRELRPLSVTWGCLEFKEMRCTWSLVKGSSLVKMCSIIT